MWIDQLGPGGEMRSENKITGSIVALVTPMLAAGEIDWPALERLVMWHIEKKSDALVSVGTTGESATLDVVEHGKVIRQMVEWAAGRIAIIGGTGANSTQEAIELTLAAQQAGVDACLLVTPYYNKPTQMGMFLHYQKIAQSVAVPLILYNVPGRTSVDLSNETALALAKIDNIVGIKDATGDLARGKSLIEAAPPGFAVYSGDDATAAEFMLMGGHGNISVTANVAPQQMKTLATLSMSKNIEGARELQKRLMPLHRALFVESNPIPVKWALYKMGLIAEGIRLPLTPLSEKFHAQLDLALQGLEVPQ